MNKFEIAYRTTAAVIGAFSGYLFGEWSPLLKVLIAFVIIDYVSGLLAAAYGGTLSSKIGYKGIAKKVMLFVIVAVSHLVDQAVNINVVMSAVVYFYLANELLSILENAGKTGLPVPEQIKSMVDVLKKKES